MLDPVIGEVDLRKVMVVFRKVRDHMMRQDREVARSGKVVRVGPAAGVCEVRAHHAEFFGLRVHALNEAFLAARLLRLVLPQSFEARMT